MNNNKGTYTLTFSINAESLDMAVDLLDEMSFEDKLKYVIENE